MDEVGIDIRNHQPRLLTQKMIDKADRLITMGCSIEEACPAVFVPAEDWALEDPEDKPLDKVREIRDQIRERVHRLLEELSSL